MKIDSSDTDKLLAKETRCRTESDPWMVVESCTERVIPTETASDTLSAVFIIALRSGINVIVSPLITESMMNAA
jgi:hypothetical protein